MIRYTLLDSFPLTGYGIILTKSHATRNGFQFAIEHLTASVLITLSHKITFKYRK